MKHALLALLAAATVITGCVTGDSPPDRHLRYTEEAILPGWTEAKDLVAIRGEPARKEKRPEGLVDYIYPETRPGQKKPSREIIYTIDQEGTVTSIRSKGLISTLEPKPVPQDKQGAEPDPGLSSGPVKPDQNGPLKKKGPENLPKSGENGSSP